MSNPGEKAAGPARAGLTRRDVSRPTATDADRPEKAER